MVSRMCSRIEVKKKVGNFTWVDELIPLHETKKISVKESLGEKKSSISFRVKNHNNKLHEQFFSGDGNTKDFDLKFSPISSLFLSGKDKKFYVYLNEGPQSDPDYKMLEYSDDYTVSDGTLYFNEAPEKGNNNIWVVFPVIEADDLVRIYMWEDKKWEDMSESERRDAILTEAVATHPKGSKNGKNEISVKGKGLINIIFDGMAFVRNPELDKTHKVIQQIISQLNKYNPNRKIYGEEQEEWDEIGNANITDKTIQYNSKYKNAIEMIEDLSSDEYTGDGQYIYWVEYNGEEDRFDFHWGPKPTDSSGTLNADMVASKVDIERTTEDVVNVVIYNCGTDAFGNGMEFLHVDYSLTGSGGRWKYISKTDTIGKEIINQEFQENTDDFDYYTDNNGIKQRRNDFPEDDAFPYTFTFEDRDDYDQPTGTLATADDKDEYNDIIRNEARVQGKGVAAMYTKLYSEPRYKAEIEIPRNLAGDYAVGEVYSLVSSNFGLFGQTDLRVNEIQYEDWKVVLKLEQDEETI